MIFIRSSTTSFTTTSLKHNLRLRLQANQKLSRKQNLECGLFGFGTLPLKMNKKIGLTLWLMDGHNLVKFKAKKNHAALQELKFDGLLCFFCLALSPNSYAYFPLSSTSYVCGRIGLPHWENLS